MEIKQALIIGNGLTRKGYPLKNNTLTSFGCNKIYFEYDPDYIVAIDPMMVQACKIVGNSDSIRSKFIETSEDEQYEPAEFNPNRPRENAGMIAMKEAIKLGFNNLICIGFDFLIAEDDLNLGNIFDGTAGYGPETRCSVLDSFARKSYFEWFANRHKDVRFTFVYPNRQPQYTFRRVDADNVFGEIRSW